MKTVPQTSRRLSVVRRLSSALALGGLVTVFGALLLAAPASADVPAGWSTGPENVSPVHALLLLGGIPALLFVVIAALVYGPALARGERIAPGVAPMLDQWLGGPSRGTVELAGPDGEDSVAGGAHGRW